MTSMRDFALNLIAQNPQLNSNPTAQQYINVLQNGSSDDIKNLAMNICNSYGVSPEDATQRAQTFFGFRQ